MSIRSDDDRQKDDRKMKFNSLVPELDVRNFEQSFQFYTETLGFKVEYRRENPSFSLLSFGEAQLMLSELTPTGWYAAEPEVPLGKGINFQIRTDDIQTLTKRIEGHGFHLQRGAYESWRESWGELVGEIEVHVFDPDGYFLRFSQLIGRRKLPQ